MCEPGQVRDDTRLAGTGRHANQAWCIRLVQVLDGKIDRFNLVRPEFFSDSLRRFGEHALVPYAWRHGTESRRSTEDISGATSKFYLEACTFRMASGLQLIAGRDFLAPTKIARFFAFPYSLDIT